MLKSGDANFTALPSGQGSLIVTNPRSLSVGTSYRVFPVDCNEGTCGSSTTVTGDHSEAVGNRIDSRIDSRVNELRAAGQAAPVGLPLDTIFVSNPFAANLSSAAFYALLDTGSGFNVANKFMLQVLDFPLGSKCCIEGGDRK
jgi:hypothetical protein